MNYRQLGGVLDEDQKKEKAQGKQDLRQTSNFLGDEPNSNLGRPILS